MAATDTSDHGIYAPPERGEPGFGPLGGGRDPRRGPVLLAVSMVVLLALVGVIWSTYHQGVREGGRDAPPRITASAEPYKVRPDDPGGEQSPHLGVRVFDVLERTDAARAEAGGDGAPPDASAEPEALDPETGPPVDVALPRLKPLPRDPAEAPGALGALPGPRTLVDAGGASAPPAAPVVEAGPGASGASRAASPEPSQAAAPPPREPVVDTSARGRFLVQIASFRSETAAQEGWDDFNRRFPDLAGAYAPNVARADLGDRGVRFRLRVGVFETRERASMFCDRLKARGGECLVVGS